MSAARAESSDRELRAALIEGCVTLARRGLAHGTSGNIGLRRDAGHFFISPTGMDYGSLQPEDVPLMDLAGHWYGHYRPSSEWRFHRDLFAIRPEVAAIVHTHSPAATALACTGRSIPAFHYMVAVAGGVDIRCAPYCSFGTQELSDAAVAALQDRRACLLANHGVIALGADLAAALRLADEVENLANQYRIALALGEVRLLDEGQMQQVLERFRSYGQQHCPDAELSFAGTALPVRRQDI